MKRNKCKKLVTILLVMLMVLTSVPVTAFAETAVANKGNSLEGKTISILGASISTYEGTSNGVAASETNSTIKNNVKYYPNSTIPDVSLNDTWWMQVADDLGLELLVNNSWSGSALFKTTGGTVGAYVDRCVQLHDDTGENAGEEPDIIGIQLGTNDFNKYPSTLGTADIDYGSLITDNGDGTFAYQEPATSLEAAAIVLHKISVRYPDAEVYYLTLSDRAGFTESQYNSLLEFNKNLTTVCEHFGAHMVGIYGSEITSETIPYYMGDGSLHPNKLGMDVFAEAFKRVVLAEHMEVSSHKVKFELEKAAADYGADKIVVDGDAFTCKLTPEDGYDLNVKIEMNGEDITAETLNDGTVTIESVTGDVIIEATGVEHVSQNYRWEFDGNDLICDISSVNSSNSLTKISGNTVNGVFSKTCYQLEKNITLEHDKNWEVEWKCEGTWKNSNSATGGRMFTTTNINAEYNARYIFKSNNNYLIAMGEKTQTGSHNYGIALSDYGIDGSELHTYRLENRVNEDNTNMIYLWVDGQEVGALNSYYIGTNSQGTTSNWLSGKDFSFSYIGTDTHGLNDCSIEYIQVWEGGKTLAPYAPLNGKVISILGDSISTFEGYIPKADGFNLEHLARYPQDDLVTDVKETWWMQVIDNFDAKLGINDSWRGATVSGAAAVTSGSTGPLAAMSNLTRIQNLGSNGTPDVIMFYGGTNDLAHVSKVGSFDVNTAPDSVDLDTESWDNLAEAYAHTLLRLQHYYPDAQIIAILPAHTKSYYSDAKLTEANKILAEICQHYNVSCVDLCEAGVTAEHLPDGIHPGAEGMDIITDAVVKIILDSCSMKVGENVVYPVSHSLSNVKASLGHYKGISAGKSFSEELSGSEVINVKVTMGGEDITESCYSDGVINIEAVTGAIEITASAKVSISDHLQQRPEKLCCNSNLWQLLEHDDEYFYEDDWTIHSSGNVKSVTFPVNEGEKITASSFGKSGTNGGSMNGIRTTFFCEDSSIISMLPADVYAEYSTNGYITVPKGATAVNIPMWTASDDWEIYIKSADHTYGNWQQVTAPTCGAEGQDMRVCSECGGEEFRDTRTSGDESKILVSKPVSKEYFKDKTIMCVGDSITAGTGVEDDEKYYAVVGDLLGAKTLNRGTSGATMAPGGHLPNKFDTVMTESYLKDVDVVTILLGVNDWNNGVKDGTFRGSLKYDPSATYYELGEFGTDDTTTIYGAVKMWCERIAELKATDALKDTEFVFMTPVITCRNRSVTMDDNWSAEKENVFGYTLRQYCNAIMETAAAYDIPVLDLNMYSGMYYHGDEDNNVDHFGGDGIHPGANGHRMIADALAEFLLDNYSYEDGQVNDCGHAYKKIVKAPTCLEDGYTIYKCGECYYSYEDAGDEATGHIYDDWQQVTAPTCGAEGQDKRVCSVCSVEETRASAKLTSEWVHKYDYGICTYCGVSVLGDDWIAPNFAEGDYSIVVYPDTQILVQDSPEAYYAMTQWIVDNKDTYNIQAALHMGDIVNNNNKTEWDVAKTGLDKLDTAGIAWMPMRGNHDDSVWFNEYFTYDKYGSSRTYFGGSYHENKLDHTYWFVTAGGREYLILSLGWAPSWDVLAWAEDVVKEHNDKNVILAAHAYMNSDGYFLEKTDPHAVSTYFSGYPNGDDIWKSLGQYPNVVLAMGGHISAPDLVTYAEKNGDGREVTSMLIDAQNEDAKDRRGMLALLIFHEDSDKVDVNWYSTRYDAMYKTKNQFEINVPHVCEHKWLDATCTEPKTCDNCGVTRGEALGHTETALDPVAPTCTKTGLTEGSKCKVCGEILVEQEVLETLEHSFGDWQQGTAPTCLDAGKEVRLCACGHSETNVIDALGHDIIYHEAKAAACEDVGWNAYETCSRCDYNTYVEIPATGHTEVTDEPVDPTCTETGLTAGSHCSICDEVLVEQEIVDLLGHDVEHFDGKEATCTEKGYEPYDICKKCDYNSYKEIPVKEHDTVKHEAKAATCLEKGHEAYEECKDCDYSTFKEKDPTGHKYGEEQYQVPTAEKDGGYYEVCTVCGDSKWNKTQTYAEYIEEGVAATMINVEATGSVKTEYVTVKWTKSEGFAVTRYNVYRSTTGKEGSFSQIGKTTSRSYVDKKATVGKTYYYKVVGVREYDGDAYKTKESNVDAAKVNKVTAAQVKATPMYATTNYANKGLKIAWTSPNIKVDGYQVYRSTSKNGTYKKVKTTKSTTYSWTNTGLKVGKKYYYKVRGYKKVNGKTVYTKFSSKGYRYVLKGTDASIASKIVRSDAVTAKKATKVSSGIKVTWSKKTSIKCNRYEVWRATSKSGTYKKIGTTKNKYYTDKKATKGKTYYYKIKGYRIFGKATAKTNYSNVVSCKR